MLDRLYRLLSGGGGLLRAEAQLAALAFRRVLVTTIVIGLALVLAVVALLVLAVAGMVMLAGEIGWAPAAAAVSGVILLASLAVLLIAKLTMPRVKDTSVEETKRDAAHHKQDMKDAVTPDDPNTEPGTSPTSSTDPADWKDAATGFVAKHPVEVASAAFAVLALVGPFRTLRLVSRGAAAAGLIGSLLNHTTGQNGTPSSNGHARASTPPPRDATPTHHGV